MGTVLLSYAKGEVQLLEVLLRKKKKQNLGFQLCSSASGCVLKPVLLMDIRDNSENLSF